MGLLSGILGNAGVVDSNQLQAEFGQLLAADETIQAGYVLVRDKFLFTDRRLILVDIQGLTGKKVEYHSIPYSKITQFSVETCGSFDLNAELKIWVGSSQVPIEKKFNKSVNIYEVQRLLANCIMA